MCKWYAFDVDVVESLEASFAARPTSDTIMGPILLYIITQALIMEVLMPPLIWQAGKTAASVRYAAVTAMATLLGKRLPLPEHVLAAIESGASSATPAPSAPASAPGTALPPPSRNGAVPAGAFSTPSGLLPLLFSALDEDWYTDLRLAACYVVEQLLEVRRSCRIRNF